MTCVRSGFASVEGTPDPGGQGDILKEAVLARVEIPEHEEERLENHAFIFNIQAPRRDVVIGEVELQEGVNPWVGRLGFDNGFVGGSAGDGSGGSGKSPCPESEQADCREQMIAEG